MPDNEISSEVRVDPLGEVTRRERRNLLAVSVFGIVFNAFNVHLQELEAAGSKFQMDPQALPFLLITSGAYFCVTFCLYYYHDIKNWSKPSHLISARTAAEKYPDDYMHHKMIEKARFIEGFFPNDDAVITYNSHRNFSTCYDYFCDGRSYSVDTYFEAKKRRRDVVPPELSSATEEIEVHLRHWFPAFRRKMFFMKILFNIPYRLVAASYIFRYFVCELCLPLLLASYAGLLLLGYCDAGWIRGVVHLPTNSNVP